MLPHLKLFMPIKHPWNFFYFIKNGRKLLAQCVWSVFLNFSLKIAFQRILWRHLATNFRTWEIIWNHISLVKKAKNGTKICLQMNWRHNVKLS